MCTCLLSGLHANEKFDVKTQSSPVSKYFYFGTGYITSDMSKSFHYSCFICIKVIQVENIKHGVTK